MISHEPASPAVESNAATEPPSRRSRLRRWWVWGVATLVFVLCLPLLADLYIGATTYGRVHRDVDEVPEAPAGLVLGTSRYTRGGQANPFYTARIRAAAELYRAGRVRGLIVSGDNATMSYNEPRNMRDDLVAAGVPVEYITLDFAGFRTLDSVVRARQVFGQERIVIVSQPFHVRRALFLARHAGIDAHAFAAADAPLAAHLRVRAREVLARAAAVRDVVLGVSPRFLGDAETVTLRSDD